ncbi:hypothetical protein [Amphritea sp.]|uniref:hypothetical protein n=1 Tax=Amphritea sp. TaxID=1872502 RepID=UPI003A8E52CF
MINSLSALCLILTMAATVCYQLLGDTFYMLCAAIATIAFFAMQWPQMNTTARILLGAAASSTLLLSLTQDPLNTAATALSRACYFATFLVALTFLRLAAKHSMMVSRCGELVVNQPPALRYGIISYASYIFGIVLNFGVIHLLGQMIAKGNTLESAGNLIRIQEKRRQRMSLALLRGFAVLPLASPFSITMTLMLAAIPDLNWLKLLPIGIATAAMLILLGWILDYVQNPHPAPIEAQYKDSTLSWLPAWKFLALILSIFSLAALIERFTPANLSLAIIILSPVFGILWIYLRHYREGKTYKHTYQQIKLELPHEITGLRSEISIMTGACFFGIIIADTLPHDTLVQLVEVLHITGTPLAITACVLITLLSHIGLNPIVTVTIIASVLTPAESFELSPELLAIGLMSGWCLAMNSSPVAIPTLLISKITGCLPRIITYRWNVLYTLLSIIGLSVWLSVLNSTLFSL